MLATALPWVGTDTTNGGTLRKRKEDQPLSTKNDFPFIHELVEEDLKGRAELGLLRYGSKLQPYNGRDVMRDIYEEILDAACYMRQQMYERDGK